MPNVFHVRLAPSTAVFVGRPSVWGNPFVIGVDGTRRQVITMYRDYLHANPSLMAAVREQLAGKDLACYCIPKACHGEVLLEIANSSNIFEGLL